jgi:hypothetical protein
VANFTGAILIIGSLFWDKRDHRQSWRRARLKTGPGIPAAAPIRYGRISERRQNTYTMVFSNELLPSKPGWAMAMPCRCLVRSADQLVQEAQALWAAEQTAPLPPGPLSSNWSAVGLLCNPSRPELEAIRDWMDRAGGRRTAQLCGVSRPDWRGSGGRPRRRISDSVAYYRIKCSTGSGPLARDCNCTVSSQRVVRNARGYRSSLEAGSKTASIL